MRACSHNSEVRASPIADFREAPLLEDLFDCVEDSNVFCILELKVGRRACLAVRDVLAGHGVGAAGTHGCTAAPHCR